jgi:hypothetical protein
MLQRDFTATAAGSDQGSERLFEMEGVDFLESYITVLDIMKNFGIGTTAGAKRFQAHNVATGLTQMREQKAGKNCFSDARIGAGDENNTRTHASQVLTTDGTDGTDKVRET